MSKFSIGLAPANAIRNGTRTRAPVQARVNANIGRKPSHAYLALVGFLGLVAGLSMTAALWRLFHFAR